MKDIYIEIRLRNLTIRVIIGLCLFLTQIICFSQRVQCGTKDSSFTRLTKINVVDTIVVYSSYDTTIRVDTTVPVYCDTSLALKNTAVFPLNSYLTASVANPYPALNLEALKIDTTKLTSVLTYGAKGDGKTFDDAAIVAAIKAATVGIIFPRNKTYLLSRLNKIVLNRNLIVWAYGATIKMADFTRYSAFELLYQQGTYRNQIIWLGGTFDGNRNKQSYPNSPSGQFNWAEDHGRLLGINYADFALVKDVNLVNVVMDGIAIESCKLGVIADCKASNGAPFSWSGLQKEGFDPDQGSYFKFTRTGMKTCYFLNLVAEGGSIAAHCSYPEKQVMDTATLAVIANCKFTNQAQDAIHIEDCYKVFMYKDTIRADTNYIYNQDVHLSNRTGVVSVKRCEFTNAKLDFRNASSLKIGVVDSCNFISEFKGSSASILKSFAINPTHVINSTLKGKVYATEQVWARYTRNSTFTDFGSKNAIRAGRGIVEGCRFINGTAKPVLLSSDGGILFNCTFINVTNPNVNKTPPTDAWKRNFQDYISLIDDKGNWLGNIKLGL